MLCLFFSRIFFLMASGSLQPVWFEIWISMGGCQSGTHYYSVHSWKSLEIYLTLLWLFSSFCFLKIGRWFSNQILRRYLGWWHFFHGGFPGLINLSSLHNAPIHLFGSSHVDSIWDFHFFRNLNDRKTHDLQSLLEKCQSSIYSR